MNQHQIKVMNYPEPSSEELFVRMASQANALARRWSEAAISTGLEGLLLSGDRPALRDLITQARHRRLLSPDGREAIGWLAETCARRIAGLADPDAPATRSRALVLHDSSEELHVLATAIDEALDLEQALQSRQRIVTRILKWTPLIERLVPGASLLRSASQVQARYSLPSAIFKCQATGQTGPLATPGTGPLDEPRGRTG